MKTSPLVPRQARRDPAFRAALFALVVGLYFVSPLAALGQGNTLTGVVMINGGSIYNLGNLAPTGGSITYSPGTTNPPITIVSQLARVGPAFFTGEMTYTTGGDSTKYLTLPKRLRLRPLPVPRRHPIHLPF